MLIKIAHEKILPFRFFVVTFTFSFQFMWPFKWIFYSRFSPEKSRLNNSSCVLTSLLASIAHFSKEKPNSFWPLFRIYSPVDAAYPIFSDEFIIINEMVFSLSTSNKVCGNDFPELKLWKTLRRAPFFFIPVLQFEKLQTRDILLYSFTEKMKRNAQLKYGDGNGVDDDYFVLITVVCYLRWHSRASRWWYTFFFFVQWAVLVRSSQSFVLFTT